jgi:2-keto-4-pentenoate hydratase/2-oxohepta-3-ene-1,7-dioic acid hydratase in catechol pathway
MILLHFQSEQGLRLGLKTPLGIVDIAAARAALVTTDASMWAALPTDEARLFAGGQAAREALAHLEQSIQEQDVSGSWLLREEDIQFGPCVAHPSKIICIGLNYRRHAEESGMAAPTKPVVFAKFPNALAASDEPVPLSKHGHAYDYEAELAVVIGRQAKSVEEADALSYVLGYCNANDVSEREWQVHSSQWLPGKTFDKFLPLGPYLVTADVIGDPQRLSIRCWVNGELRQSSTTADMIFSVAQIISYLSHCMTLEPGDIISTGTPEGVILGMQEKHWLTAGDEMVVEIETLGRLTNRLVADQ